MLDLFYRYWSPADQEGRCGPATSGCRPDRGLVDKSSVNRRRCDPDALPALM